MLVIAAVAVTLSAVAGKAWSAREFPNPMSQPELCGRKGLSSHICDPDGILTYEGANKCEGLIKTLENMDVPSLNGVVCPTHHIQLGLALVARMSGSFWSNKETNAQHFAQTLHDAWGVGDSQCQSGVLFFLDRDDRTMYISTGRGAKTLLTDTDIQRIITEMKPTLRDGDYDGAISSALAKVILVLKGQHLPEPPWINRYAGVITFIVFGGLMFLVLGGPLLCCFFVGAIESMISCCRRGCHRCRYQCCPPRDAVRLRELLPRLRTEARTQGQKIPLAPATMCAICLEDFPPPAYGSAADTHTQPATRAAEKNEKDEKDQPDLENTPLMPGPSVPSDRLRLRCGHEFHITCLAEWCAQAAQPSCPLCREKIRSDDLKQYNLDGLDLHPAGRSYGNDYYSELEPPEYPSAVSPDGIDRRSEAFYLWSAHRRYPRYVTRHRYNSWSRGGYYDHGIYLFNDYAYYDSYDSYDSYYSNRGLSNRISSLRSYYQGVGDVLASSSSSSSSSSSWGGGSSFGGGGGGGSW